MIAAKPIEPPLPPMTTYEHVALPFIFSDRVPGGAFVDADHHKCHKRSYGWACRVRVKLPDGGGTQWVTLRVPRGR